MGSTDDTMITFSREALDELGFYVDALATPTRETSEKVLQALNGLIVMLRRHLQVELDKPVLPVV